MASQYFRLMDPTSLVASTDQDLRNAIDVGAFNKLEIDCRILKSGSAGNLILEHAAVLEENAFRALATATWAVNASGGFVSISDFLRYVRWSADGSVAGACVAMIDIIAKE